MAIETLPSEQTVLDERIAGFWNGILDFLGTILHFIIPLLVLVLFIIICLFVTGKLQIKSIIPPEIIWSNKSKSQPRPKRKIDRLITDTPPPAPKDKRATLPLVLLLPDRLLKKGDRQRIAIQCDNQSQAEEYGRLWFHKLFESDSYGYDRIGWIDYEKKKNQNIHTDLTLAACFYNEFWFLREEFREPDVRYSKQMEYFKQHDKHTILFVNLLEFPEWVDRDLRRYSNLPGLSVILLSDRGIDGYTSYVLSQNGGETQ